MDEGGVPFGVRRGAFGARRRVFEIGGNGPRGHPLRAGMDPFVVIIGTMRATTTNSAKDTVLDNLGILSGILVLLPVDAAKRALREIERSVRASGCLEDQAVTRMIALIRYKMAVQYAHRPSQIVASMNRYLECHALDPINECALRLEACACACRVNGFDLAKRVLVESAPALSRIRDSEQRIRYSRQIALTSTAVDRAIKITRAGKIGSGGDGHC